MLEAMILAVSAISVNPSTICNEVPHRRGNPLARYAHCKKGDLIRVDRFGLKRICDLKSGTISTGGRTNPWLCVYRGKPRKVRPAPKVKSSGGGGTRTFMYRKNN